MMRLPNRLEVIDNTFGNSVIEGPARLLDFGEVDAVKVAWMIDLPTPLKAKPNQLKAYLCGPYPMPLADLDEHLAEKRAHAATYADDPKMSMKDIDLLSNCKTDQEKERLQTSFNIRDARYRAITPIITEVKGEGANSRFEKIPLARLLQDDSLPGQMIARAKELKVSLPALYNWLHKYLAGGCQKNSLLSNYGRVGNPGQPKIQNSKLGRSPQPFKDGVVPSRGLPLTDDDKEKLAWGFGLIDHSMTPKDAYLVTCMTFWSERSLDARGQPKAVMFVKYLRPTFAQFMRWGAQLRQKTVTQILLGPTAWRQSTEARGGSEQDRVAAIGQEAMFDGTTTDVYLAAYSSRLKKLPPMTRLILKESRLGIIYGIYCGWLPASPATASLAILNGAMPPDIRAKWGRRFGAEITENEIPQMLARNHLCDNGELKAQSITEAEEQFGFGVSITSIGSGDKKGGVETQHRSDHHHLDKKLPGATHGKPRQRGQDHAAVSALWNYYEYMSELIKLIIWHNTVQEVPNLAPDEMLLKYPDIKPTRMNIFRWLTERHMNVSLPVNYEALRAFTLTDVDAVIRKNGIYLEQKILGRRVILLRLRYNSPELVNTGLMSQVKRTGKSIRVSLKMDRNELSEAWLPTKAGMIPLKLTGRNETIRAKLTLDEWIGHLEEATRQKLVDAGAAEQAAAEVVLRRMGITESAEKEAADEIAKTGKPPTKSALMRDLDKNRAAELEMLKAQEAEMSRPPSQKDAPSAKEPDPAEEYSAVDAAMDAFHAEVAPA